MADIKYPYQISNLIAKEILGEINQTEKIELESWIYQDSNNKKLYDKIKNNPEFLQHLKNYNDINIDSAWKSLSAKLFIPDRKKLIFMNIMKYAALFIFIFFISAITFHYLNKPEQNEACQKIEEITPGNSKARLILADGQSLNLDDEQAFDFMENDGTIIQKRKKSLDYSADSVKAEEGILHNVIEVPHGGEYTLVLSDGTTVYLNSISKLKYPVRFSGKYRIVELSGEAFFDVANDPLSPFIVKIHNTEIEVLGTCFNVNAYEKSSTQFITLEQGKIKIHNRKSKNGEIILQPDHQAIISLNEDSIKIKKVNALLYSAWRQGKIIFRDERLEDIMDNLSRWYNIDIFYLNSSIKDLRFGGSLNKYESIVPILDIFALTNKVKYKIDGTSIMFY